MNIVQELEIARRKLAKLEAKRQRKLRRLAPSLGFESTEELIGALQQTLVAKPGPKPGTKADAKPKAGRKRRVVITKEIESGVGNYAKRGWTSARIAAKLDISVPTVQNIKKRLGLVKARR
jgi:DNA-binding NarL/FixJ family response regulator